jgi:hypothetical protein
MGLGVKMGQRPKTPVSAPQPSPFRSNLASLHDARQGCLVPKPGMVRRGPPPGSGANKCHGKSTCSASEAGHGGVDQSLRAQGYSWHLLAWALVF